MSPGTARAILGIEDQEIGTGTAQVLAQRQAHLPAANNNDVVCLHAVRPEASA